MSKKEKLYNFTMAILAVISIILVILDYASVINLNTGIWMWVDNGILVIFAIDYFYRLTIAEDKWSFFKHNIFDLLSIIPVNGFFTLFRLARLGRLARLARLIRLLRVLRLVGLTGRLRKILYTNGLIYLLYTSLSLLIVGAITYSMTEHVSLAQSFWWAIATATTVGYGDISPHTFVGKIVALVLMLVGIGVIGMLTSSITTYFVREDNKADDKDVQLEKIMQKLDEIEKQNHDLKEEIQKLKQK